MSVVTSTVLDAIYDWVQSFSGLAEANVIWEDERGPTPEGTYISMELDLTRQFGHDWTEIADAEDPVPGADLQFSAVGARTAQLRLQCFAGCDRWITARPVERLGDILSARSLPSQRIALRQAGIGFGPISAVQSVQFQRAGGSLFEPRAIVTMELHLVSRVSELGTWIEKTEITGHENTMDVDFPVTKAP